MKFFLKKRRSEERLFFTILMREIKDTSLNYGIHLLL